MSAGEQQCSLICLMCAIADGNLGNKHEKWFLAESIAFLQGAGPVMHMFPPLSYDHAALEPLIDARTMKLHHDMHQAIYLKHDNRRHDGPAVATMM